MGKFFHKLMDWFRESHRWQHFAGGALIGLFSNGWYCAAYAGTGIASAMEFKDRSWGGAWDWADWTLTISGAILGYALHAVIRLAVNS